MKPWEIINSPIFLTLISLVWGSFIASAMTYMWQKQSHNHELRLAFIKEILTVYHQYIRLLKGNIENLKGEDFDEIHGNMRTLVNVSKILFRNTEINQGWEYVSNLMTTVRSCRLEGKFSKADKLLLEAFKEKNNVTEKMYKAL